MNWTPVVISKWGKDLDPQLPTTSFTYASVLWLLFYKYGCMDKKNLKNFNNMMKQQREQIVQQITSEK